MRMNITVGQTDDVNETEKQWDANDSEEKFCDGLHFSLYNKKLNQKVRFEEVHQVTTAVVTVKRNFI